MATTMFFEETLQDQRRALSLDLEFGRSSFYPEQSIYLVVDGKTLIMSREQAKRFVEAAVAVGHYLSLIE